jgi:hypothetical protein
VCLNNDKADQYVAVMTGDLFSPLGFAGATGTLGQIDSSDEVRFKF